MELLREPGQAFTESGKTSFAIPSGANEVGVANKVGKEYLDLVLERLSVLLRFALFPGEAYESMKCARDTNLFLV
jgi:hypothetical protein